MISLKALMLGKPYHRTTTPKRSKSPSIFIEPGITRLSGPQIRGPTSCGTGLTGHLSGSSCEFNPFVHCKPMR